MESRTLHAIAKRGIDLVIAASALLLLAPMIAIAGLAVRLDSEGPAFFRSQRVGRGGRRFHLWKLRTMGVSDEELGSPFVTAADDPRITRVGRWLRRTRMDELPQLWNVMRGQVSLVGPRPEVPDFVARFPVEYAEILRVRPGLTDRATLRFLDEEALLAGAADPEKVYVESVLPQKIALYLAYVRNPSLREDLRILGSTALRLSGRVVNTTKWGA